MGRLMRDPVLLVFSVLVLISIPTIAELAHHYPSIDQRIRHARPMVSVPPAKELLALLRTSRSVSADAELHPLHVPERQPRSGLAAVYELRQHDVRTQYLVVLRHDIECGKCRDILAMALYDRAHSRLEQVVLIEPIESEKGPVDATSFLARLAGRPLTETLQLGRNVDGITGATGSTKGLMERLNEAALWLREYREVDAAGADREGAG